MDSLSCVAIPPLAAGADAQGLAAIGAPEELRVSVVGSLFVQLLNTSRATARVILAGVGMRISKNRCHKRFYSARGHAAEAPITAVGAARNSSPTVTKSNILTYGVGATPPGLAGTRFSGAAGPHFKRTIPAGPSRTEGSGSDCLLFVESPRPPVCRGHYGVCCMPTKRAALLAAAGPARSLPHTLYIRHAFRVVPLQINRLEVSVVGPSVIALFRWVVSDGASGGCLARVVAISPAGSRRARESSAGTDTPRVSFSPITSAGRFTLYPHR